MLGNFSVGDYFKQGPSSSRSSCPPRGVRLRARLRATSGSRSSAATRSSGSAPTRRRSSAGARSGVPDERIVLLGRDDNFWQSGPTGPCGPCSELYLDRGPGLRPRQRPPGRRHRALPRVLEPRVHAVRAPGGRLAARAARRRTSTPAWASSAWRRSSRASSRSTRPTCFGPLIELGEELSGRTYGQDFADHPRAAHPRRPRARRRPSCSADGVVPSNEERGYVLRRIMRRAIQQGRVLGIEGPFLPRLYERVREVDGRRLSRAASASGRRSSAGRAPRRRASAARSRRASGCWPS